MADTSGPREQFLLEVCVDNLFSAINAEVGGAGRLELCSSLAEGGLTPTPGFLKIVKAIVKIPVFAMIRPRGGDFVYTDSEIEIMKEDIKILKDSGVDGIVFGILTETSKIHRECCSSLISTAAPLPCTFHRAFDLIIEPEAQLEVLISLGFNRILTSGQKRNAEEGIGLIQKLVRLSRGRLVVMAGAGLNPTNVGYIIKNSGVTEVHGSCRTRIQSNMKFNKEVLMGSDPDEMNLWFTDTEVVRQIVNYNNS